MLVDSYVLCIVHSIARIRISSIDRMKNCFSSTHSLLDQKICLYIVYVCYYFFHCSVRNFQQSLFSSPFQSYFSFIFFVSLNIQAYDYEPCTSFQYIFVVFFFLIFTKVIISSISDLNLFLVSRSIFDLILLKQFRYCHRSILCPDSIALFQFVYASFVRFRQ